MNELLLIIHLNLLAHSIVTILFLIVTLFNTTLKNNRKDILGIFNKIALSLSLILTICILYNFVVNGQIPNIIGFENVGFSQTFVLLFQTLVPMLFFIKRLRQKIGITLFVILALNLLFLSNFFMVRTSFYRDFSEPSGSFGNQGVFIILIIIFSLLYLATIGIIVRQKNTRPDRNRIPAFDNTL